MPILRCPNCYVATTVRQDSIDSVSCVNCGVSLYDFYYAGKSEEESRNLINEMGTILKKKKATADRARKKNEILSNSAALARGGVLKKHEAIRSNHPMENTYPVDHAPRCSECAGFIGSGAEVCPHCGFNLLRQAEIHVSRVFGRIILLPVLVYLSIAIATLYLGLIPSDNFFFSNNLFDFPGLNWLYIPLTILFFTLGNCKHVVWGGWLNGIWLSVAIYFVAKRLLPTAFPFV
jgi:Zn ribbon nucleic-acid-binding protein